MNNLQESGEMYLETILVLSEKGDSVHAIEISKHMGFSKPSVSRAVGLLKNDGFITVDKDGSISLTDSGREVAEKIYDRHKTITMHLISIGVDEKTAAEDACKIEHVISDKSFAAFKKHTLKEHLR